VNQPDGTPVSSWEARIARHLTPAGSVVVPARVAKWLETKAGITPEWRAGLRDTDPGAYEVLMALHCAATQELSVCGTNLVVASHDHPPLDAWLTPAEAAEELHVTDRCIRNWCSTGRLPATMSGNRWLIRRTDLHMRRLTA
jgi:excisionase family DNA binding protein